MTGIGGTDKQKEYVIEDNEEFYILGLPIKTNIGNCHFLKVKDYPNIYGDLNVVSLTKQHFINLLSENNNTQTINELKNLSLFEMVLSFEDITKAYITVFEHFFRDKQAFFKIENKEEFYYLRKLVLKLSCIKEEFVSPNPEIQRMLERSRELKNQKSGKTTFADIVTSVVGVNGLSYKDINNLTLYQLYMTFYRIAQVKNYDTSTLFATVADKVEIDDWSKHINILQHEDDYGISMKEFRGISSKIEQ